jgi:hypothetical protein
MALYRGRIDVTLHADNEDDAADKLLSLAEELTIDANVEDTELVGEPFEDETPDVPNERTVWGCNSCGAEVLTLSGSCRRCRYEREVGPCHAS